MREGEKGLGKGNREGEDGRRDEIWGQWKEKRERVEVFFGRRELREEEKKKKRKERTRKQFKSNQSGSSAL
jgi:hypothetical protein